VLQFLAESVVMTLVSALLALVLVYALLPRMDRLTGTFLHFNFRQFPELPWLLGGLVLLTGLLSGAYPALILSGFRPLEVLKSKVRLSGANLFTRSLVVLQFVLSAGLVVTTVIIEQQVSFMRSRDLGFQKENVIDVDASGVDTRHVYPLFREAISRDARVKGVTAAGIGIGEGQGFMGGGYHYLGKDGFAIEYPVEPGYIGVLGMKLTAGRDFNANLSPDSTHAVVVNQALLEEFHISPDSAIGQVLQKADDRGRNIAYSIIGVVNNFNFTSLSNKVQPQLFSWPAGLRASHIYVRVGQGDPSAILAFMGQTWKSLVPGLPFQYAFLDEEMNRFYRPETRWSQIIAWAGGISICLACLGLFGLAALAAVNRSKEISIRKVLGASIPAIVGLLSGAFSGLLLIALFIAFPLAAYWAHKWLQGYAYHIAIAWWVFALTGLLIFAIALVTVGFHGVKAALTNPVDNLRQE
jgi:putative ABC transport system permease protein